jgi:hypothetical protein
VAGAALQRTHNNEANEENQIIEPVEFSLTMKMRRDVSAAEPAYPVRGGEQLERKLRQQSER